MAFGFGVGIQRLGSIGVATRAELLAITPSAGTRPTGFVFGDVTAANNGVYSWNVSTSAWVRQRALPDSVAVAETIGGTANAITGALPAFVDPGRVAVVLLTPTLTNTGAVTFNGLPVRDAAGVALVAGALVAGRSYLLQVGAAEYRTLLNSLGLISDIAGLQAALNAKLDASSLPAAFSGAAAKASIIDADAVLITDSAASNGLKRFTWANIKTTLKAYFDPIYAFEDHIHAIVTTTVNGFMSAADKVKLDGLNGALYALAARQIIAGNGLTGGGALGADRTLTLGTPATVSATSTNNVTGTGHSHELADLNVSVLTAGTLPLARGGTGGTTEQAMRGVYTGTSDNNTAYPIGAYLVAAFGHGASSDGDGGWNYANSPPAMNGIPVAVGAVLRVGATGSSQPSYGTSSAGAAISGVWRSRGITYGTGPVGPTTRSILLLQRVS